MVGSDKIDWPDDGKEVLGLTILLIRKFAENPDALIDFGHTYYYSGNKLTANLHEVVRQVLIPFSRDFKTYVLTQGNPSPKLLPVVSSKIFIVHGHDGEAREAVARFISSIDLEPIILHEQANRGRTVIEKVEANSDVGFAVVLLTPDDVGNAIGKDPEPRARQNVLLELGYFIGKLGRERVCSLKRGVVGDPQRLRRRSLGKHGRRRRMEAGASAGITGGWLSDRLEQGHGMNQLAAISGTALPEIVNVSEPRTQVRFLEFFAANIRNLNTRRAYARAAVDFMQWCADRGVTSLPAIQTMHVAAWIEELGRSHSMPTVKLRLSVIRNLFDWMVVGQAMPSNPAHTVRAPRFSARRGKTPVLAPEEARQLLNSIPTDTVAGLRDRALIAMMTYSFARIGAVTGMEVQDVYVQNRRLWLRLHEKSGKRHEMPCHHTLEEYLDAYIDVAGLRDKPRSPLFRTIGRGTAELSQPPHPGRCLCDDPATGRRCRHQNRDRQSHVPGDGHHRLPEERGDAGKGRAYGQSRLNQDNAAL